MWTHFAELHRVIDLLYFLQSVLDHLLNISLDSFHLSLDINTGIKIDTRIDSKGCQCIWRNDGTIMRNLASPFSPDSLAPLGQCRDCGAPSRCTAHTHTSGRSCRTAPGAFDAFYKSASPALPLVQSACEFSRWQLSGVAPGDSHNMRSDTQGRISRPLFASPCTHHNVWIFLPLTSRRSAFSLGSAGTFPWQRSFHKALGGPQRQSDIWDSWWWGCRPSVTWCRWSRNCDRRGWRRAQRKHHDRWNTETGPLTAEHWGRPWPHK